MTGNGTSGRASAAARTDRGQGTSAGGREAPARGGGRALPVLLCATGGATA